MADNSRANLNVNVDVSEALTGLKALQREAKKATQALAEYGKIYEDFWKDIVTDAEGNLDVEQVKRELHDYKIMLDNVPTVYDELAGLSKPLTHAQAVIDAAREKQSNYARDIYLSDIEDMVDEEGKVDIEELRLYFK
ncbi:hypothetical protein [Peribacillus butanolivorans]|nr:hypothetical protein [Peribacillus butanolivorans]